MRAVLVLLLLVLAAELLLRVYHARTARQRLPVELRAETRALTWDAIRDKYRVVCLGDSITYGEDLHYAETYPAVLADMLQSKRPDQDLVGINSGLRGNTAVEGLARLERDVLSYRPHVVVIAFGLNDGNLGFWPLDRDREQVMLEETSLRGRVLGWLNYSHLWRTLSARLGRSPRRDGRRLEWGRLPWPAWVRRALERQAQRPGPGAGSGPWPRVSAHGFEVALTRMATRVQQGGCPTVLMLTTTPVVATAEAELDAQRFERQAELYAEYNRIIAQAAAGTGSRLVDVHALFEQRGSQGLAPLLAGDGVHLTPAGERLLAEFVSHALDSGQAAGDVP
jgi:lysophospholipase L1-like esterase